jgi:hypothetical protein
MRCWDFKKMVLLVLIGVLATTADAGEVATLDDGPAKAVLVPAEDTATLVYRCDFEDGVAGWNSEQDEKYKPWCVTEPVKEGFRGSKGALKTTVPSQWNTLGPFVKVEYAGKDTKVTCAYRTRGCKGLIGQGEVPAKKKKLHGSAPGFRDGRWMVHTLNVENWVPWSGGEIGRNEQFSTLMIYAEAIKDTASELVLDDVLIWQGQDKTPPDRVRKASGSVDLTAGEVVLAWDAPPDNIVTAKFEIHRGIKADFTPSAHTLLGTTSETSWRDGTLNNFGSYYYKFVAEDAAGNRSEVSGALKVVIAE